MSSLRPKPLLTAMLLGVWLVLAGVPTVSAEIGFRCPMLYYHEVPTQAGLEAQLAALVRNGYQPTTMSRVLYALDGATPPPPGCVVLTFDDGLRSQYRNALPVLTRWAVSGTFFVMPSFRDGVHAYMTPEEIGELAAAGMEVGSHTLNHASLPPLRRVNPGAFFAEIELSRRSLEEITGQAIDIFAYPNGSVDGPTAAEVQNAGYRGAVTTVQSSWQSAGLRYTMRRISANSWEAPSTVLARMAR